MLKHFYMEVISNGYFRDMRTFESKLKRPKELAQLFIHERIPNDFGKKIGI